MITVMCSVYNSERYLDGYLESINNQLLNDFHIIFVDAKSTDKSLQKLEKFNFRKGISSEIIRLDKTVPIYAAWNIAIDKCSSDYILNVNSDDRLFPGGLLIYQSYLIQHPTIDVFYGPCQVCKDANHNQTVAIYKWAEFTKKTLLESCIIGPFPLVKTKSLIEAGKFDPSFDIIGDYEMWLRMAVLNFKFKYILDTVGSYYHNPDGISTKNLPANYEQAQLAQDKYRESLSYD